MHGYRRDRLALVQILYEASFNGKSPSDCISDHEFFVQDGLCKKCDYEKVKRLLTCYQRDKDLIENLVSSCLSLSKLEDATLCSIIRAGVCEMLSFKEIPRSVIADEYTSLGRMFLSEKSVSVVNAVVDKVGNELKSA